MTDTRLDRILCYGTAAERGAFTPDPPAGVLVIFYEEDTAGTYFWDTDAGPAAWVAFTPALASIADDRILANISGGPAAPTANTLTAIIDACIGSVAQGDILYRNGTVWTRLGAGTSGYFLKTQGAGADPIWDVASGGAGAAWHTVFTPADAEFPATNYAQLSVRNNHPILAFDTTTQETCYFSGVLHPDYAGGGVTVTVYVAAASATTGTIGFDVAFERIDASSLDIDADSFATAQTITATTVPGTAGQILVLSVNISNGANMDSLAAGEAYRIQLRRDVANDTATGDAQVIRVTMVEQ